MKKMIDRFKNLPDNEKRTITIVLVFVIGISLIGLFVLYNNSRTASKEASFKTIKDTGSPTPKGEVAGESDKTASTSPTVTLTFRRYLSPTPTRPVLRFSITPKSSSGSTGTTSGSSGTSTTTTTSATATPKPTSTSVPPTSVPNTPVPAATNTPVPAPTATPTPGPSLSVSVSDGKINATATIFGEIHVCIFHFRDKDGVSVETKEGSKSEDKKSCSTDTTDNPAIQKVVAYLGTLNGTIEVEKSRPF